MREYRPESLLEARGDGLDVALYLRSEKRGGCGPEDVFAGDRFGGHNGADIWCMHVDWRRSVLVAAAGVWTVAFCGFAVGV